MATSKTEVLNFQTRGLTGQLYTGGGGFMTLTFVQASGGDEGVFYPAQSIDVHGKPAIEAVRDAILEKFPLPVSEVASPTVDAIDAARWRFLLSTCVRTADGYMRMDIAGCTIEQFTAMIDKEMANASK